MQGNFEKRQALLDAALEEFTVHSYDDASLNNIIKTAGVSKGNFYYHYKNKQDLYLSLIEEVTRAKLEYFQKWALENREELAGKDIFETLKLQGKAGLEFAAEHPKYYLLGKNYTLEKNEEIKEIVKQNLGTSADQFLKPMIEEAVKKGEIRSDFSLEFIQRVLYFLFLNFDSIFLQDHQEYDIEKIMLNYDAYIDFIKNGLRA